jgi:hypothetical protein
MQDDGGLLVPLTEGFDVSLSRRDKTDLLIALYLTLLLTKSL